MFNSTTKIKARLSKFAERHKIKFAVLFGSRAKRPAVRAGGRIPHETSDFDIAVALDGHRSIFFQRGLYGALLDFFSAALHTEDYKIDLTDLNRADILLRYEVASCGTLLYGDEDDYAQFRAFAFKDYMDAGPLFALEERLVRKRQPLLKKAIVAE